MLVWVCMFFLCAAVQLGRIRRLVEDGLVRVLVFGRPRFIDGIAVINVFAC
jgi:hypothetical protein